MVNQTYRDKILKERAKILQKTINETEVAGEQIEVLEFLLSEEKYAIDSTYISEVIRIADLTPLPCTPSFILGIINKRGQILSVVDIKKFFNLPEKGITNLNRVIVVKHNEIEIGILTDEIIGNTTVNIQSLQKELPALNKIANNYVMGISKERLIVLDIKEMLLDEKIIINEEI
ncbi:MAG: chemotaxis protein CheW [Bacteroidetes bacterium]|nr:chemotaxis protein CheW [Bacteroidota bacterium]